MKSRSIEELKEIALKYHTKKEFRDNDYNAYVSAAKRGLLKEVCEYAKLQVLERRDVTDEEVIKSARKYKTRKEFRENEPNNYYIVINRKLGEKAFKHMEHIGNKYYRCIYVYEFEKEKVCYVGLTYNLNKRNNQHRLKDGYTPVLDFAKNKNIDMPNPIQLTDYLPIKEAAKKEDEFIQKYKNDGWVVLNKQSGGNLGGSRDKITYTKETCKELALKYDNKTEFSVNHSTAYKYVKLNGWDEYVFSHMKSKSELVADKLKEKNGIMIDMYDYNGNKISEFKSETDAFLICGLGKHTITNLVLKKAKHFCKGYFFCRHDEKDDDYFNSLTLLKKDYKYVKYDLNKTIIEIYKNSRQVIQDEGLTPSQVINIPFNCYKKYGSFLWKREFILDNFLFHEM